MYEVIWTDPATYSEVRQKAAGVVRGDVEVTTVGTDQSSPGAGPLPVLSSRYQILAEVGRGGMGVVYKAQERETGDVVALKVLKPDIAADASILERFKNEVRLARRITHKNVCRIFDFNRTEGTAYISMEFVEGENLRRVVARFRTLSLRTGLNVARQICAGLREAHGQGIVHRDLKPENVMLDHAGNVKLMDFGMARWIQGSTGQTGALVGTPSYMAPEQAEGKPVDHRADIYTLGLILYEVFTGTVAFRGDTPVEIAMKQVREIPTPPRALDSTLSPPLEKIILRCLEKNPARRFQSVDELEAALNEIQGPPAETLATTGKVVPLSSKRQGAWRNSRKILAGALVASALIVAFLLVQAWRQSPPPAPAQPPVKAGAQPESAPPVALPPPPATPPSPPAARPRSTTRKSKPPAETKPAAPSEPTAQPEPTVLPEPTTLPEPATAPEQAAPPPPAASSEPKARSESASPGLKAGFYVQVGSFAKAEQANELAGKLRGMGYNANVAAKRSPTKLWFRAYNVLVGPHATASLAQAQKTELEGKGFKNARLVQER